MHRNLLPVMRTFFTFFSGFFFLSSALLWRGAGGEAFAQQNPQYNQYMFNPLIVNPAYAGSKEQLSTVALHRSQWVGFDGAPMTQTIAIHAPFKQRAVGLGLNIINDKIGPTNHFGVLAAYAYRIHVGPGKLSFGLRTGAYNYAFNWNKIEYKDQNELAGINARTNHWIPVFDYGMRYQTAAFYAGFTMANINRPIAKIKNTSDSLRFNSVLNRYINITAGYAYMVTDNLVLRPSLFVKAVKGQRPSVDANASVLLNRNIWLGLGFRTGRTLVAITEYKISSFLSAGYSFDYTLGKLQTFNSGSHEIFVCYEVPFKKSKVLSPRYF